MVILLLTYAGNLKKELKNWEESYHSWLAGFIGHFPLLVKPACSKYLISALCPFLDFLVGIFRGLQKRGSWLKARARRLAK